MGFLKKSETGLSKINSFISLAFAKVKQDMLHVTNWLNYFHQKHQQHDYRLDMIEQQLEYIPKSKEEIRQIVDSYYSYDHLVNKIKELGQRLEELERKKLQEPAKMSDLELRKIHELNQRLSDIERRKFEIKSNIKERIIKKITKNSKDYVKNVIASLIKKYGKISAPQLKEMVVEEQRLCSKSSFYRILIELEKEHEIDLIQEGKEKIYLFKAAVIR